MDKDKKRELGKREMERRRAAKSTPTVPPVEEVTSKSIPELKEELAAAQTQAMTRIFEAKATADEVDQLDFFDERINKVMTGSQKSRVIAEEKYERMMSAVETAKEEFLAAGQTYAEAVHRRVAYLEEALFGDAKNVDLNVRLVIGEKSEEQLDKLLTQALDSRDEELANLVFLAAHTGDHPLLRSRYFEEAADDAVADRYHELLEAPEESELAHLIDPDYFAEVGDPAIRNLPTLEDLAIRKPTPPILTR